MVDTGKQFDVAAVASDDYLSCLARRLEALEKKIVGKNIIGDDQPPLKPTLEKIEKRLTDDFTKTEGVSALWSKISDLEKVLDPNYLSNLKLSDSAKSELLIGYAEQLKDLSKPIEELQQLKDYVNHTEFQGLEDHEKRLTNVARSHAHQEQQVAELSQQVHQLLSAYSKIMLQLSAQFIEWGEVTKNKAN